MKCNSYNLSPREVQAYVYLAHEMRREFIIQQLRRGWAALSGLVKKATQQAAYHPKPKDFCSQ
ncbi:MAG: hypothetical protein Q8L40_03760 [Burkholderiales bacterium]|nr:hypothetical protein [Burkholderiales bacterium]MDP2241784.1 hypothetical protein [Burkholderiales bacterium]